MRPYLCAAAALLFAAATTADAQTVNTNPPRAPTTRDFVEQAALTNMFEIAAARTAEQKRTAPAYQAYARMIIRDHTRMSDELKSETQGLQGVASPSDLDPDHARMLKQLQAADDGRFEQQYRSGQIAGHRQAIQLFHNYSRSGSNPRLRSLAASALPKLHAHLAAAERLPHASVAPHGVQPRRGY